MSLVLDPEPHVASSVKFVIMTCRHTQKTKTKDSGRKDDAFLVSDGHESDEDEVGGKRKYVVVGESDDDDVPIGIAAIEQLTAQRKVCLLNMCELA